MSDRAVPADKLGAEVPVGAPHREPLHPADGRTLGLMHEHVDMRQPGTVELEGCEVTEFGAWEDMALTVTGDRHPFPQPLERERKGTLRERQGVLCHFTPMVAPIKRQGQQPRPRSRLRLADSTRDPHPTPLREAGSTPTTSRQHSRVIW